MKGYKPLDVLKLDTVQTVDCGTCPVTMACAVDKGGNGYAFPCCNSTGFLIQREDGSTELLMIDCDKHNFEQNDQVIDMPPCPLCTGNAVAIDMIGLGTPARWIPTVHAKHSTHQRIAAFHKALPEAEELAARIKKRRTPDQ